MKIRIRHELEKHFKENDFKARFLIKEEDIDNYSYAKLDAYIAKHRRQSLKDGSFFSMTQTRPSNVVIHISIYNRGKERDYWDFYNVTILED